MITVIGVRFRTAGKIYYFDPAGREVKTGDHVIVETARGIAVSYTHLGRVHEKPLYVPGVLKQRSEAFSAMSF